MNELDFKRFLEDKSWDYSKEEIEQLMEEELLKEPEDINMEFVDACMSYLTGGDYKTPEKVKVLPKENKKRVKPKKLFIAAVAAVLSITASITAFAAAGYIDAPFVNLFTDHAAIDYSEKDSEEETAVTERESTELYNELARGGIADVFLPSQLYDMEHEAPVWQNNDTVKSVVVNYSDDMYLMIQSFTDEKWVINPDIMGDNMDCETVNVNGVDVYLLEEKGTFSWQTKTTISYEIGLTQYSITCKMTMSEAKDFIKNMN